MPTIDEKTRFRWRKGQWRRRTLLLIEELAHHCRVYKGTSVVDFENSYALVDNAFAKQQMLEKSASLIRFGVLGETHLSTAKSLDFSSTVVHDIRMMLLAIAAFGSALKLSTGIDLVFHLLQCVQQYHHLTK